MTLMQNLSGLSVVGEHSDVVWWSHYVTFVPFLDKPLICGSAKKEHFLQFAGPLKVFLHKQPQARWLLKHGDLIRQCRIQTYYSPQQSQILSYWFVLIQLCLLIPLSPHWFFFSDIQITSVPLSYFKPRAPLPEGLFSLSFCPTLIFLFLSQRMDARQEELLHRDKHSVFFSPHKASDKKCWKEATA